MAKNLRAQLANPDSPLHVHDVAPGAAAQLVKETGGANVHAHASAAEVARHSDVVITMLPAPAHVRAVYAQIVEGLAADAAKDGTAPRQKVFIDSSTIDVKTSVETAQLLRGEKGDGHLFFDAPVSGGTVGATNASLTFMVGGVPSSLVQPDPDTPPAAPSSTEEEQLAEVYHTLVRPTLATMGKTVVPCGGPGMGLAAKLANNYLLALTNVATAESFQLARALGLDLRLYSRIVASATGRSWSSDVNNPVPGMLPGAPASRDYLNGFGLGLMRKDLGLALEAADHVALPLLLGNDAYNVYTTVEQDDYCKDRDMSVIYKYIENLQKSKL